MRTSFGVETLNDALGLEGGGWAGSWEVDVVLWWVRWGI